MHVVEGHSQQIPPGGSRFKSGQLAWEGLEYQKGSNKAKLSTHLGILDWNRQP